MQYQYDVEDYKKRGLIKPIQGQSYLTVQGRLILAHTSGQLAGVAIDRVEPDDRDWIAYQATVKILNPNGIDTLIKIKEALGDDVAAYVARDVLFHTFEGVAKSAAEGSERWNELKKNATGRKPPPEVTNPTEVASTSAVGRALGAAGFGETESFATFEEVKIAEGRQDATPEVDPTVPTNQAKAALFAVAKAKLPEVRDAATFDAYVQKTMSKPAKQLTAADVRAMTSAIKKLDDPTTDDAKEPQPNF